MLIYSQTAGTISKDGVLLISGCYAGRDHAPSGDSGIFLMGENNPALQQVHDVGPLPQGQYTISPLHTIPHLGPCMALTPAPANQMFGRSGFFIHLDNPAHIGASSDGCVVLPYQSDLLSLEEWRASGEDQLQVTA